MASKPKTGSMEEFRAMRGGATTKHCHEQMQKPEGCIGCIYLGCPISQGICNVLRRTVPEVKSDFAQGILTKEMVDAAHEKWLKEQGEA